MKKISLCLLFVCFSIFTYSQDKVFKVTPEGYSKYLVLSVDSLNASEIYKKTLEWVSLNYKNPEEVVISKIDSKFIRIKGYRRFFNGTSDCQYIIELEIKDGKIKFTPTEVEIINGVNRFQFFSNFESYFKSDGTVKPRLEETVKQIENTINVIAKKLEDFLNNSDSKGSEW